MLSLPGTLSAQDPAERLKVANGLEFNDGKRSEAAAIYRDVLVKSPAERPGASRARPHPHRRRQVCRWTATSGESAGGSVGQSAQHGAVDIGDLACFEGNAAAAVTFYQQVFDSQLKANAISPAANTANALARTLLETGDLDNAAKWYRTGYETAAKIQNVPPEETDIWEMRWRHAQGRIAARRKQFDAARDHLAAVEGLVAKGTLPDGQQSFAPQLAGYIAFYQGHYDEAIAALAKADQQDPFVLGLLAQAHEQKQDMATAKEHYARVLARPGFPLQMALARPLAARRLAGR